MRSIKKVHGAEYRPIDDLITYSPLPTRNLQMIDPFIFLNHHGFQVYPPKNDGLPFGPHPHRGMETITFIVDGDIMHKDSGGHESVIKAGGIQWMTAGSGLIHAEVSSEEFKANGGDLEILQMWVNLPARLKMTKPFYKGLQKEDIPCINVADGVNLNLISGEFNNQKGAFDSLSNIFMSTIELNSQSKLDINISTNRNVFFYVVRGEVVVNGKTDSFRNLVEFNNDNDLITIEATQNSLLIFGHAEPFNEPVVARGPFVMNTELEIMQAYRDYQMGKFGVWTD